MRRAVKTNNAKKFAHKALAVSLACLRAGAKSMNKELYEYVYETEDENFRELKIETFGDTSEKIIKKLFENI